MSSDPIAYLSRSAGAAVAERPVQAKPQPAPLRIRYTNLLRLADATDLIPQAVFNISIEDIARRSATFVEKGSDDLDSYRGVGLKLANVPFAFINYRGHPEDTSSLYLPREYRSINFITRFIAAVMEVLKLAPETLSWQRRDDPDL